MTGRLALFLRVAALGPVAVALLLSRAAAGEAPWLSIRPTPRPDPQAEWREERRDAEEARRAFEAGRREDRQDWLWGGSWREWLDDRRAAERARTEDERGRRLERRHVRPGADVRDLGRRLEEQWERQRDRSDTRRDSRFPGPRPRGASPIRR